MVIEREVRGGGEASYNHTYEFVEDVARTLLFGRTPRGVFWYPQNLKSPLKDTVAVTKTSDS